VNAFAVPLSNSIYYAQTSPVPQCIAFDNGIYLGAGVGNTVFYTGNADNSIIRYDWVLAGAPGVTIVSNTVGPVMGINNPRGMVTDTQGRLYVSNAGGNSILRLNITNTLLVSASVFYSGALLNNPGPLAIDNLGNIYVASRVSR
jgi:sugar lactone lactonase YvrE